MNDVWAYIQQNPMGAAVLVCAGASIWTSVSALFVALRGGANKVYSEYSALGRSLVDSRLAQERKDADYAELRSRVAELSNPPKDINAADQPTSRPED